MLNDSHTVCTVAHETKALTSYLPGVTKIKIQEQSQISFCIIQCIVKQMVPCKRTAEEVSFEWSHHRISSTDSKVNYTTCLHN